jgi:hypothetical protein
MNVKDTPFQQPDVSHVNPLPVSGTRSDNTRVVFVNDYGRYETFWCFWDDIEKVFRRSSNNEIINLEAVRQYDN